MSRTPLAIVAILLILSAVAAATEESSPDALMDAGHWKRARAILEPRANAQPGDARIAFELSRVRLAFGDDQEALKLAEAALAKDDKSPQYHYQTAEAAIALTQGAGMFKAMSLSRRARQEWQAAIGLDSKYIEPRESLMEFYLQAPGIAGGDKDKARSMSQEIAALDPLRGLLAQATIAVVEKHLDAAAGFYQQAVKTGPHDYRALTAASAFFSRDTQNRWDLAEQFARDALSVDAGRSGAYALLAACAAHRQQWKDLDSILSQSEKNVSDDLGPFYQAGKVLLLDGHDLPRAEGYFRKYLTQDPEGYEPHLAAAHWRLALVLEKEGRKPDAVAELQTALKIKPDFEDAKKDLKRLQ